MSGLRFAILGCGRMGRHHSEQLIADGRGQVVALLDADRTTADSLQQSLWPNARVCSTFAELIGLEDVDAAIICTPTVEHSVQAHACLGKGWHVLCEKPLAATRDQILALIAAGQRAAERKQAFSLGYQRRHTALYRTLRREVRSGKWGRIRAVVSHNVENWQPTIPGTWRDDPQRNPGGFLTDAGSHKLDQLFFVTGLQPREVFARSQTWGSHVEIVTSASALLENDVTATIDFIGHAQYLGEDLAIHCEHADLMIRHGELWIGLTGKMERLPVDEPDSNPVASLLDTILNGAEDRSPPSAALPVFDLTQAMLQSSRTTQLVKLATPNQYTRRTFRLSELTRPNLICVHIGATTKEAALREMIELLLKAGIVSDGETLVKSLLKREELGSSGLTSGCAVPHAKSDQVNRLHMVVGLSRNGIDWGSIDGESAHFVFLQISPRDRPGDHLRGLEMTTAFLQSQNNVNFLKQCRSGDEVYELLLEFDQTAETAN